jgi:hypothetical protein
METIVTVLAVLVIAAPLVVLALRTTRWDPLRRAPSAPSTGDADARRAAVDVAALQAHRAPVAAHRLPAGNQGDRTRDPVLQSSTLRASSRAA